MGRLRNELLNFDLFNVIKEAQTFVEDVLSHCLTIQGARRVGALSIRASLGLFLLRYASSV